MLTKRYIDCKHTKICPIIRWQLVNLVAAPCRLQVRRNLKILVDPLQPPSPPKGQKPMMGAELFKGELEQSSNLVMNGKLVPQALRDC